MAIAEPWERPELSYALPQRRETPIVTPSILLSHCAVLLVVWSGKTISSTVRMLMLHPSCRLLVETCTVDPVGVL